MIKKGIHSIRNTNWRKIPLFNKYGIAVSFFLVWMIVFDKNNVWSQWKLRSLVHKMEAEKEFLESEIERTRNDRSDIERNKEKFARERYLMHQDDEDVFVIVKQ